MEKDLKIFIAVFTAGLIMVGIFSFGPRVQADDKSQTINVTVTTTLTFNIATDTIALGTLTPGTPIIATTSCTVETNSGTGWQLSAKRNDANSTLDLNTDESMDFPDATAWNGSNSTETPGANLSFRVYQTGTTPAGLYSATYWGTNDSSPKWAGFPSASVAIASLNSYQTGTQTVVYGFRIDAPSTQASGAYSGSITLTAVSI